MKKLKTFIKGETINLSKPTLEFAKKSNWYSWVNDRIMNKHLLSTYKKQKTVYTKGKYDTREAKGAGGRVIGGSVKSKREVIRGKNPDA